MSDYVNGIYLTREVTIFVPFYENVKKENVIKLIEKGDLFGQKGDKILRWDEEETDSIGFPEIEKGDEILMQFNGENFSVTVKED